jgi:hypothetical protein
MPPAARPGILLLSLRLRLLLLEHAQALRFALGYCMLAHIVFPGQPKARFSESLFPLWLDDIGLDPALPPDTHEYTRTSLVRIHSIASAGFTAAAIMEKRFLKVLTPLVSDQRRVVEEVFSSFGGSIFSVGTKDLFMFISRNKECIPQR